MSRKLFVFVLFLAVLAVGQSQMDPIWDNWVKPQWAPSWTPNANWTIPSVPAGFKRNVIGQSTNPNSNVFELRLNHYLYESTTQGGVYQFSCGPESYLLSTSWCSRNPYYWSPAMNARCRPDKYINFIRYPCQQTPSMINECCYRTGADDLHDYMRIAEIYPPGA